MGGRRRGDPGGPPVAGGIVGSWGEQTGADSALPWTSTGGVCDRGTLESMHSGHEEIRRKGAGTRVARRERIASEHIHTANGFAECLGITRVIEITRVGWEKWGPWATSGQAARDRVRARGRLMARPIPPSGRERSGPGRGNRVRCTRPASDQGADEAGDNVDEPGTGGKHRVRRYGLPPTPTPRQGMRAGCPAAQTGTVGYLTRGRHHPEGGRHVHPGTGPPPRYPGLTDERLSSHRPLS